MSKRDPMRNGLRLFNPAQPPELSFLRRDFLRHLHKGLRVLVDLGDSGAKYPTAVIAVTEPYLRQNRLIVKKFLMGFMEGLHLYKENKAFTLKVMQKFTKFSNQETLSLSHDYFVRNTSLLPRTDPEGVKNAIPEDKIVRRKVEEFYDNSLIEELVNEGFLAKLQTKK